jgi:tRNA(Arg) A34 adenosine deaminase TadA
MVPFNEMMEKKEQNMSPVRDRYLSGRNQVHPLKDTTAHAESLLLETQEIKYR